MEKIKIYGCLFLAMLSCFELGLYAASTVHNEPVELHRWALTSLFGLVFLGRFLVDYRKR
jgi:hypothetical protein